MPDRCRSLKLNGSYRAHIDTSLWVGFTLMSSEVRPHQVLMSLALMSNSIISVQLRSLISKTNDLFVVLSLSIPQHFYKMPLDIREKKEDPSKVLILWIVCFTKKAIQTTSINCSNTFENIQIDRSEESLVLKTYSIF